MDDLAAFIAAHADAELMDNGKVRCTLTGHEMPGQLPAVQSYWSGKKYRNAKGRAEYDFAQHEPWIVQHTKNPNLLYCTLTKQPVSKETKAVEGHVNGKRFKQARAAATLPPRQGATAEASDAEMMDDEDEEDLEAEEVEGFLSGGARPFWEGEDDAPPDEPPTVERTEGGRADAGRAKKGAASSKKTKARAATATAKASRSDEPMEEEEDERFWVSGARGAVPARVAEQVGFTESGERPKKKKRRPPVGESAGRQGPWSEA